jgi:hypothetical protein
MPTDLRVCEPAQPKEPTPKCAGCGRKCKRSSVGWACPSCEELEFME